MELSTYVSAIQKLMNLGYTTRADKMYLFVLERFPKFIHEINNPPVIIYDCISWEFWHSGQYMVDNGYVSEKNYIEAINSHSDIINRRDSYYLYKYENRTLKQMKTLKSEMLVK